MKALTSIFLLLLLANPGFAQDQEGTAQIKWISIEEAEKLNAGEPRKVIIDLYTSWCGWCKRMDASTFSHPAIAKYISENYYAVKLDAETRDTITFMGHQFVNPTPPGTRRGTNEIASIGSENGRLGYPTIVYLDEKLNRIGVIPGYQTAEGIEPILTYFAEDHYKTTPWTEYQSNFKGTITSTP